MYNYSYSYDYVPGLTGVGIATYIVSMLVAVAAIVAMWRIFSKAGEPGWAAIVPLYNTYVLFKITWGNGWTLFAYAHPPCQHRHRHRDHRQAGQGLRQGRRVCCRTDLPGPHIYDDTGLSGVHSMWVWAQRRRTRVTRRLRRQPGSAQRGRSPWPRRSRVREQRAGSAPAAPGVRETSVWPAARKKPESPKRRYCAGCGNLLSGDEKFCGRCGAPLE